ncbi:nitrogen regulatory protein P-II family [Cyclonatronum proteinivorum]|uniref:Nitrogen regulatory protein P-II family n=1 Tax=Cyclonatronum proteinivorum TaxID=1457365 RepID=A0A345UJ67_9BACT|nr:P-II family nitrogen regulator [Cyclonatronum proteinivorum]AXJ00519.1 nitrogen regulatory protein P-II family [Cyclonatronum proteinivorum]
MTDFFIPNQKLLITIVSKNMGSEVVAESKKAGCKGGTIIPGTGTRKESGFNFWGFDDDPEKDVVFSIVDAEIATKVLQSITKISGLDTPGKGIGFVLDVSTVTGLAHIVNPNSSPSDPDEAGHASEASGPKPLNNRSAEYQQNDSSHSSQNNAAMQPSPDKFQLIVSIVDKGSCDKVVEASRKAGAEGGTIIYGRGTGIREKTKLFSMLIEPEKEVVLTLIPEKKTELVLKEIVEATELNQPGKGIAFVLNVESTAGICHRVK